MSNSALTWARALGVPVYIDNRVPATRALRAAGLGIIVNVETYWHLRYPPQVARFACELRRRTLERLRV